MNKFNRKIDILSVPLFVAALPVLQTLKKAGHEAVFVGGSVREPDLIHRGDPGRHGRPAGLRQAPGGLRHGVLAVPRGRTQDERERCRLHQEDHSAPAGRLQPSGANPPHGCHRLQWHDRGRYLRQRQLHPHHGLPDAERHRRLGRLHPQRLFLRLRDSVDGEGRGDLGHYPDGQPCGPHRTRRGPDHHGAGTGRPARPGTQAARPGDHRELRTPGLQGTAARVRETGRHEGQWAAHPA